VVVLDAINPDVAAKRTAFLHARLQCRLFGGASRLVDPLCPMTPPGVGVGMVGIGLVRELPSRLSGIRSRSGLCRFHPPGTSILICEVQQHFGGGRVRPVLRAGSSLDAC
jgi:hypothetical protein